MLRGCRRYLVAVVGCLILVGQSEQGWSANYKHGNHQEAAKPTALPQTPNAKAPDRADKHCYGTSSPWLSCDAISAQASIDQARDADKQAAAVWWQFGVGALTLAAAVAAAIFAGLAAFHTKRSADAATGQTLIAQRTFTEIERPHLFFEVSNDTFLDELQRSPLPPPNGNKYDQFKVDYTIRNYGRTPAVNVELYYHAAWKEGNPSGYSKPIDFNVINDVANGMFQGYAKDPSDTSNHRFIVTGYIKYRSVIGNIYETHFQWIGHREYPGTTARIEANPEPEANRRT